MRKIILSLLVLCCILQYSYSYDNYDNCVEYDNCDGDYYDYIYSIHAKYFECDRNCGAHTVYAEEYALKDLIIIDNYKNHMSIENYDGCIFVLGGVKDIEKYAFSNNVLEVVKLPDTVHYIGVGAFYNNSIHTVYIPPSVKYIDVGAFQKNDLDAVKVSIDTFIHDTAFDENVEIIRY